MKFVPVDTSVWSLALRKKNLSEPGKRLIVHLMELICEIKVIMIGQIRQEIVSGISDANRYEQLREYLSGFADYDIKTHDYESAAKYYNLCRSNGIQGSHTDYLLCSLAVNNDFSILTLDNDFKQYQKYIDINLEEYGERESSL